MEYILNGQAQGDVASTLLNNDFDIAAFRPFIGADGRSYVTVNAAAPGQARNLVSRLTGNATATLRKDEWKLLDTAIIKAALPRLRLVGDLRSGGLTYSIGNGMAKTVLQSENQGDISDAQVSMDGLREGDSDRPHYDLVNLPLPITSKDFHFSARQIATSRNGGSPLDTTTAELAARKVSESIEKMAIGTGGNFNYGGGNIYGLINFPSRITRSITAPTATAWTAATTLANVLAMREDSKNAFYFGPWTLYASSGWDEYLDNDFSAAKGDNTLRERLLKLDGIDAIKTLDYLTGYQLVLVQKTTDVIREVIGMDMTTVQWPSKGGFQVNYKVLSIMVPQLRADQNGNTGIVHGS